MPTYIYDKDRGCLVDKDTGEPQPVDRDRKIRGRPQIAPDYEGYTCPVSGKWVEGRAAHAENLKRTGCRLLEKGESREAGKRRDESFERNLDRTLDNAAKTMAEIIG